MFMTTRKMSLFSSLPLSQTKAHKYPQKGTHLIDDDLSDLPSDESNRTA